MYNYAYSILLYCNMLLFILFSFCLYLDILNKYLWFPVVKEMPLSIQKRPFKTIFFHRICTGNFKFPKLLLILFIPMIPHSQMPTGLGKNITYFQIILFCSLNYSYIVINYKVLHFFAWWLWGHSCFRVERPRG